MDAKKVDIFGSFLSGSRAPEASPAGAAPHPEIENELLSLLAKAPEPISLRDLVAQTSGSPTQTLKVLEDMQQFKLVRKTDGDSGGRYALTSLGNDLAPME
ncbi:hypothetical protein [Sphingomonas sp. NFR15]|uniref:hypothetical protein n=1 Tax=Sphingomonas sp. NFR15 TaxID=1566282 RepID=UPI00088817BC|nr:hypothetical protein [Sphingomonas sp. NFR15]SDA26778.1 hypothetical protein SAMN03159340_02061 [Sphingomonas sp. NFR15]